MKQVRHYRIVTDLVIPAQVTGDKDIVIPAQVTGGVKPVIPAQAGTQALV